MEVYPGCKLHWSELACHDRMSTPYPMDYRTDPTRLPALVTAFRAVRFECTSEAGMDCPLLILSAYRTPEYNAELAKHPRFKAAKTSQHIQGRALDLACPRMLTFAEFQTCVERASAYEGSPIRYIEFRPSLNYIHIDVRPTKRLVEETIP